MAIVDILIPSVDNPQYLYPCLESLSQVLHIDLAKVIVVNNGGHGHCGPVAYGGFGKY